MAGGGASSVLYNWLLSLVPSSERRLVETVATVQHMHAVCVYVQYTQIQFEMKVEGQ